MNQYTRVKFSKDKPGRVGRKRTGAYFHCEACKREFYVYKSRIEHAEKMAHQIRYCSQKCQAANMSGDRNPFWGKTHSEESIKQMASHPNRHRFESGPNNPNAQRFGNWFGYKSAAKHLRGSVKECQLCGWDKRPELLQVHHQDRNRLNNALTNVILICPNCHQGIHYDERDGAYSRLDKKT